MVVVEHAVSKAEFRHSCEAHAAPMVPPSPNSEGGQLLFEIEHSIETKPKCTGRPAHLYKGGKENKVDPFKGASDAVVGTLCELLNEVGFEQYSIVVNRRVLRASEREAAIAMKYPSQVEDQNDESGMGSSNLLTVTRNRSKMESSLRTDRTESSTVDNPQGGNNEIQLKCPSQPCPRARKCVAARYPRPGSFELTTYDVQRQTYRVVYSKYHKHVLPSRAEDILQELLPFMVIFAGHTNDEPLMNRITEFANSRNMIVQLSLHDLREGKGTSLLLNFILSALEDLCRSLNSGDPDQLDHLMQAIPHGLRTEDVLMAERRLEHLLNVEKKVSDALSKIEQGYVTSGMESLQRAIQAAEKEGLCGTVMDDGVACLRHAQDPEEDEDADLADDWAIDDRHPRHQSDDTTTSPQLAKSLQRASTEKSIALSNDVYEHIERNSLGHESEKSLASTKIELIRCSSPGYSSCGSEDRRPSREMSRQLSKDAPSGSLIRRSSGSSKDGKLLRYSKRVSSRSAMEKAENEITHQKEEMNQLKEKLLTAVNELSTTLEDEFSVAAREASETTLTEQTQTCREGPPQVVRQNSKQLVKASRNPTASNEGGNAVSQIDAELDSLLSQVRRCVSSHRDESQHYKMRLQRAIRDHEETEAETERKVQDFSENLLEQVSLREQAVAEAQTVEVQSTVVTALERAVSDLQTERASRAQASCENAFKFAIRHECGYHAMASQEKLASQLFAREAFWCEVDVCDALMREQEARRIQFADLVECELAVAQAAYDEQSTRQNASMWVADSEAAAQRARQELLACEMNSCEAIARESAARHSESEATAARHAIACMQLNIELAESGQALADEQSFAASEAETCKNASALLVESQAQANAARAQEVAAVESCKSLARQMELSETGLCEARDKATAMEKAASEGDVARKALASAESKLEIAQKRYEDLASLERRKHHAVESLVKRQDARLIANQACRGGLILSHDKQFAEAEQKLDAFATEVSLARSELQSERTKVADLQAKVHDVEQWTANMVEGNIASPQNTDLTLPSQVAVPNDGVCLGSSGVENIALSTGHENISMDVQEPDPTGWHLSRSLETASIQSSVLSNIETSVQPAELQTLFPRIFTAGEDSPLITGSGEEPRGQEPVPPPAEMQLGSTSNVWSSQSQGNANTELAAPGEAPFDVQEALQPRVEIIPLQQNASPHALANASRGEAPVSELEAECAPGEAPFARFGSQSTQEQARTQMPIIDVLTGDPLVGASTGEAPLDTDGLQDLSIEAQVHPVEVETPQEQEGHQARGDSTGEAPQTEAEPEETRALEERPLVAHHSTGSAPQTERRHAPQPANTNVRASNSTGEAPQTESLVADMQDSIVSLANHSHSTGGAPQIQADRAEVLHVEEALVTLVQGQTSPHSTGEAPQVEGPGEDTILNLSATSGDSRADRANSEPHLQQSGLAHAPEPIVERTGRGSENDELTSQVLHSESVLQEQAPEPIVERTDQGSGIDELTSQVLQSEEAELAAKSEEARLEAPSDELAKEGAQEEEELTQQAKIVAVGDESYLKAEEVAKQSSEEEQQQKHPTKSEADTTEADRAEMERLPKKADEEEEWLRKVEEVARKIAEEEQQRKHQEKEKSEACLGVAADEPGKKVAEEEEWLRKFEEVARKFAQEEQQRKHEEKRKSESGEEGLAERICVNPPEDEQQKYQAMSEIKETRVKIEAEEPARKLGEPVVDIAEEEQQQKESSKVEAQAEEIRLKAEVEKDVAKEALNAEIIVDSEEERLKAEEVAREIAEREQQWKEQAELDVAARLKAECEAAPRKVFAEQHQQQPQDQPKTQDEESRLRPCADENAKKLDEEAQGQINGETCLEEKRASSKEKRLEEEALVDSALAKMMNGLGGKNTASEASLIPDGPTASYPELPDDVHPPIEFQAILQETDIVNGPSLLAESTVTFDAATDTDDLTQVFSKSNLQAPKLLRRASSLPAPLIERQRSRSAAEVVRQRRRTWSNGQNLQSEHQEFLRAIKNREAHMQLPPIVESSQDRRPKHAEIQTDAPWNHEVAELRLQWSLLRERCQALERQLRQSRSAGERM